LEDSEQAFGAIEDVDALARVDLEAAHAVVRLDRQLTAAAVHENGKLDPARAAVVQYGIDRGADGTAGVEHVVDQDDAAVLQVARHGARPDARIRQSSGGVVAVHRDVDAPDGNVAPLYLAQATDELSRYEFAPTPYADDDQPLATPVTLEDLSCYAPEPARNVVRIEHDAHRGPV
jgi:hypothetical protein